MTAAKDKICIKCGKKVNNIWHTERHGFILCDNCGYYFKEWQESEECIALYLKTFLKSAGVKGD